jgi:hypothetical protein
MNYHLDNFLPQKDLIDVNRTSAKTELTSATDWLHGSTTGLMPILRKAK